MGRRGPTSKRDRCAAQLLVVLLLGVACQAYGRITDASVVRDERDIILIATPFGFGADGYIDIEIKDFQHWPQPGGQADLSRVGIVVTTAEAEAQLEYVTGQGSCALEPGVENVLPLLTFADVAKQSKNQQQPTSKHARLAELVKNYEGGQFSLFFTNCERGTIVSFDIRVSLYNVGPNGKRDYLSVGEDMLPALYMAFFVLFAVAAALWVGVVLRARAHSHHLHYLMFVLVAFKALTLLSQAGMFQLIRTTGHPDGWNIAFYVFTLLRGVLFFTVVVLIGTGWSYMRPLLQSREKKILAVVIPLQVIAEVAIVVLDENTPASRSFVTWRDVLHLIDIICCCAVLFPIVWSIKHLKEAAGTDGKAARNLLKLQLFRQFYVMVVIYIYFTRIVVFLLNSNMPYKYSWLSEAADVTVTLAFYVAVAIAFRPMPENPYLQMDEEELEELRQANL